MKGKLVTVFEDDHLLVINKPSGLLSVPDRYKPDLKNVYDILKGRSSGLMMTHRLDKETSGLLVVAKNKDCHRLMNEMFLNRTIIKKYVALLEGNLRQDSKVEVYLEKSSGHKMRISPQGGKWSSSMFHIKESFQGWTYVEVEIATGRTHQIRVHAAHIGHPLVADPLYGKGEALSISDIKPRASAGPGRLMARTALHAHKLEFTHPVTNQLIVIEAPLPKDFKASLNQLRKWRTKNQE